MSSTPVFGRVRVAHLFSFLCCPVMCLRVLSSCCDVRYDFRINTMIGSSLPQLFVGGLMSSLRYLCLFVYSGVRHILWCVFCFVCLRRVSYVPNVVSFSGLSILVASFSGLSIRDCSFGFL